MRRGAVWWAMAGWWGAALVPACRCQPDPPAPTAQASASVSASAPAASASASASEVPALGAPWAAARRGREVWAVGPRREGEGLWLVRWGLGEGAPASAELSGSRGGEKLSVLETIGSEGGLAVRLEDRQGRGLWWRAPTWEALAQAAPEPMGASVCAVAGAMLGRGGKDAAQIRRWRYERGEGEDVLAIAGGGSSSVLCGSKRAYAVVDNGKSRTLQAIGDKVLGPVALEAREDEQSLAFAVEQDTLVVARIGPRGEVGLRRWEAEAAAPEAWWSLDERVEVGSTIEAVMMGGGQIALVLTRHVEADSCKGAESFHTVAEVAVAAIATRKLVRPRARLDTWRCGAEPGPFGGGTAEGRFVVTWPRGADATCARLGVRYGGLGFLELPHAGEPRAGRVDAPAADLIDLGCEAGGCGGVVLARGEGTTCWAANDPRGYAPRWLAYP